MPLEIRSFIRNQKYGFNNWIIQDYLTSTLCGFYCLGLLLYLQNSPTGLFESMNDYVNLFVDDTKKNDGILRQFYRRFRPSPVVQARLF